MFGFQYGARPRAEAEGWQRGEEAAKCVGRPPVGAEGPPWAE